ncbi:MAG: helicase-associated domain-containing protein [Clostridiales Family XIII bacterium]|jgi:hypothetical protein|nr:helicase-associated domain-containing protein [Clostridiales Family XIII bacterium]
MIPEQVEDLLYELPLADKGRIGSLRHLAYIIGGNVYSAAKSAAKEQVVSILSEYYCAPNRFELLWNDLSAAERKIISLHIWGSGSEPVDYADEVAVEFGLAEKSERFYYYYSTNNGLERFKTRYAGKNSALWLFFPKSDVSSIFQNELCDTIGEMRRVYSEVPGKFTFSTRENRTTDFANIVRFCNSNKLTVTKSGIISKSAAMKLLKFCGYEEYATDINLEPEDMRTSDGLLVTLPLTVFCVAGGLLVSAEGVCAPGRKTLSLVSLPHGQLIKKLFEAYLKSKSFDEISIMRGIKSKRGHNPVDARQNIAEEMKYCPIGQAVDTREFERYLRIAKKTFARKEERYVVETGNNYYDYSVKWEYYEHLLINIILSFFGALGIIDIVWGEGRSVYADRGRRIPVAFRINPLGAYVLGLTDSYAAPDMPNAKIAGGFTVLPDYTIVIPDSLNRLKHELYFEKLFTKVSSTDEASIYRLDFETVVRATDSGESIDDLRKYLLASDKPTPKNVVSALADWEKQVGRIRLRQVTILECDDDALLAEVIRYKGMGELVKEKISAAIVVEDGATKKIKKVIEKNNRFCKDVI